MCARSCGSPKSSVAPIKDLSWLLRNAGHTSPQQSCRGQSGDWRAWHQRNLNVIEQLAEVLERPAEDIANVLYDLTFQNFGKLLSPEGSGWNWIRVPYCQVDVCDGYLGLFDANGNLQDPMHPRSLFVLLQVMQSCLNCGQVLGKTSAACYPSFAFDYRPFNADASRPVSIFDVERVDIDENAAASEDIDSVEDEASDSGKGVRLRRKVKFARREGKVSAHNQLSVFELRRLLSVINAKRGLLHTEDEFLDAVSTIDLEQAYARVSRSSSKQTYDDLSSFYSDVVSNKTPARMPIRKVASNTKLKGWLSSYGRAKTPARHVEQPKKDRKYFGEQMPVLVYEPYDESKLSNRPSDYSQSSPNTASPTAKRHRNQRQHKPGKIL